VRRFSNRLFSMGGVERVSLWCRIEAGTREVEPEPEMASTVELGMQKTFEVKVSS